MLWSTLLYTNPIGPILRFWKELKKFIWQVLELKFIGFVMQENYVEEVFFEDQKRVIGFFFNHIIDGVVHKLIRVEG
jgi:hypothetical protein